MRRVRAKVFLFSVPLPSGGLGEASGTVGGMLMVNSANRVKSRLAVGLENVCNKGVMTNCVPKRRPGNRLLRSKPSTVISVAGRRRVTRAISGCGMSAVCGLTTLLSTITRTGPRLT